VVGTKADMPINDFIKSAVRGLSESEIDEIRPHLGRARVDQRRSLLKFLDPKLCGKHKVDVIKFFDEIVIEHRRAGLLPESAN